MNLYARYQSPAQYILRKYLIVIACSLTGLTGYCQSYNSVQTWLQDLSSQNILARNSAALGLDSLSPDKETGYKELLRALGDKNPFVRQYVSYQLGTIQYKPKITVPVLIAQFRDQDKKVRQYACVAVAMYGDEAIHFLLDTLKNNKGPLDDDGPSNYIRDEDSVVYKSQKGIYRSGTKNSQGEYFLTRTSLYCLFCLRMIDEKKVTTIAKDEAGIPRVFKMVLSATWKKEFDETEYYSVGDKLNIPRKNLNYKQDTAGIVSIIKQQLRTPGKAIYSPVARINGKTRYDTIYENPQANSAYANLLLHPYFLPHLGKSLFINGDTTFNKADSLKILTILANSGRYGLDYLAELNNIIQNANGILRLKAYLAAGYILINNYGVYEPEDSSEETAFYILPGGVYASDPLLFKEITPFYLINYSGLSGSEDTLLKTSGYGYGGMGLFYNLQEFEKHCRIKENPGSENDTTNDSLLKLLVEKGLDSKDIFIQTMALHFSTHIHDFDSDLQNRVLFFLGHENYYLQEAAVEVAMDKKLMGPSFANLAARLKINRYIIERFHSENRRFFGGEGTLGLGAWGAGGSGGNAPAISLWPPAPCTIRGLIDITSLYPSGTLGLIKATLENYLQTAGFPADFYRVFPAADGFAIMTRSEKTDSKGDLVTANRWSKQTDGGFFSILSRGNVGYWRTITFVVTKNPNFMDNGTPFKSITNNEDVYNKAGLVLPKSILEMPCRNYYLQALVYHYYQKNGGIIREIQSGENSLSLSDHLRSLRIPLKFQ